MVKNAVETGGEGVRVLVLYAKFKRASMQALFLRVLERLLLHFR